MDQNRWAECVKINQNERNEVKKGELGHRNDPNEPKFMIKRVKCTKINGQNVPKSTKMSKMK